MNKEIKKSLNELRIFYISSKLMDITKESYNNFVIQILIKIDSLKTIVPKNKIHYLNVLSKLFKELKWENDLRDLYNGISLSIFVIIDYYILEEEESLKNIIASLYAHLIPDLKRGYKLLTKGVDNISYEYDKEFVSIIEDLLKGDIKLFNSIGLSTIFIPYTHNLNKNQKIFCWSKICIVFTKKLSRYRKNLPVIGKIYASLEYKMILSVVLDDVEGIDFDDYLPEFQKCLDNINDLSL